MWCLAIPNDFLYMEICSFNEPRCFEVGMAVNMDASTCLEGKITSLNSRGMSNSCPQFIHILCYMSIHRIIKTTKDVTGYNGSLQTESLKKMVYICLFTPVTLARRLRTRHEMSVAA